MLELLSLHQPAQRLLQIRDFGIGSEGYNLEQARALETQHCHGPRRIVYQRVRGQAQPRSRCAEIALEQGVGSRRTMNHIVC